MKIEYLADRMDCVPVIAKLIHDEWGFLRPNLAVEKRIADIERWGVKRKIPTAFVALSDDRAVGCAALIAHDMDTRMDLSPWLASVIVVPEYRKQRIASALVRRIAEEARTLAVTTLYLYTDKSESLYAGLGWTSIERTVHRGLEVVIMTLDIAEGDGPS
jgi:N-acetylglutamate synthase-like GNAT family acetyltransferase